MDIFVQSHLGLQLGLGGVVKKGADTMRSIIRFSVNGEKKSALRNKLNKILTEANYVLNPHVTATYEHAHIPERQLANVMRDFWDQAGKPPGDAYIDHVWMYSDNPPT